MSIERKKFFFKILLIGLFSRCGQLESAKDWVAEVVGADCGSMSRKINELNAEEAGLLASSALHENEKNRLEFLLKANDGIVASSMIETLVAEEEGAIFQNQQRHKKLKEERDTLYKKLRNHECRETDPSEKARKASQPAP